MSEEQLGAFTNAEVTRRLPVPLAPSAPLPLHLDDPRLDTPAVLVDLDVMEANISRLADFAERSGLKLRPHIKTHKSIAVARRQLAAGAAGICTSGIAEASAMAAAQPPDLLIAYPVVGRAKLDRLAALVRGTDTPVLLVSDSASVTDGYRQVASALGTRLRVLVEVDTGMRRVGAEPKDVAALAEEIAGDPVLEFGGIMTHAGHSHDATDEPGIHAVARQEAAVMGSVRTDLEALGLEVPIVSAGSTITSPYLSAADGITEIRPGTYVYNDLRTLGCHACTPDAIAATVLATVVSAADDRITIDAGNKTLTMTKEPPYGFGHLLHRPGVGFSRLSEEHGVMRVADGAPVPAVGDRVRVLPIHVCVWMDLQPEVYGIRRGQVVERLAIDAMRHSL
jgi:D-serine deaminase-like pyridoxal phosphate-dependent protein